MASTSPGGRMATSFAHAACVFSIASAGTLAAWSMLTQAFSKVSYSGEPTVDDRSALARIPPGRNHRSDGPEEAGAFVLIKKELRHHEASGCIVRFDIG
jgi:hypothetical protein